MERQEFNESEDLKEIQKLFLKLTQQMMKQYQEALEPISAAVEKIKSSLASISIPDSIIEIPKFLEIDWDKFYKALDEECSSNAKFGWCISAHMSFSDYRRIGHADEMQDVRDRLFTEMFEENSFELYELEKRSIIHQSNNGWREFYKDCFQSVEDGRIKVAIPSLLMAIEHELSENNETDSVGKRLINSVQLSIEQTENPKSVTYIMAAALFSLLKNGIFEKGITGPRSSLINRNRVLHGRDDPSLWNKTDIYRLISIISALKMFQIN